MGNRHYLIRRSYSQHLLQRTLFTCLMACFCSTPVLWAQLEVRTDRSSAIYKAGESMSFLLRSTILGAADYIIRPDSRSEIIQQGTVNLFPGQAQEIPFSLDQPDAVVISLTQNGQTVKAGAVFSPFAIQSLEEEPADFDAFWDNAKAELAAIPADPELDLISTSAYSSTYSLSLGNIDGRRVYGYISIPSGTGPFPAIITLPAAGSLANITVPEATIAELGGAISVSISIHNSPPDEEDPSAFQPDDYDTPDGNYYKQALLGIVRTIDYLFSRPDFDGENLGLTGVSQGGGLALMAAGLDDRVRLVVESNAALCRYSAFKYQSASSFPFYLWRSQNEVGDPAHFEATLSATKYYDAVFFARRFDGPSYHIIGYEDDICPPATVFAAYNETMGSRVLLHARDLGHSHPGEYWNGRYDFFRQHFPSMRTTPPVPFPGTSTGYIARAGEDLLLNTNSTALQGQLLRNELPLSNLDVVWEKVSGPGAVSFTNANGYNTNVTFDLPGTYVLRFSGNDFSQLAGEAKFYTISDHIQIVVEEVGDQIAPEVSLSTLSNNIAGPVIIDVAFSEPIEELSLSDFSITNGTLSDLNGTGASYNFTLNPTNSGTVLIRLPAGRIADLAGNLNLASNNLFLTYSPPLDNTPPIISLAVPGAQVSGPFEVTIFLSEELEDFELTDFSITNGQGADLTGADLLYTLLVEPTEPGEVRVQLPANQVNDPAGNPNPVSNLLVLFYEPGSGGLVYCDARGEQPWEQWIGEVRIADLQQVSFKEGYGDFTEAEATISQGASYSLTLVPDYSGFPFEEHWRVWIDYNQDGDFLDAGEQVVERTSNAFISPILFIPHTAKEGPTRMRIAMKQGGYAEPCETFLLGEVEDYQLNIVAGNGSGGSIDYCGSASQQPWEQWIAEVKVADITQASDKATYTDFTPVVANWGQGRNYALRLTPGYSWQPFEEYWTVWVDWNGDRDFEDVGEKVFEQSGAGMIEGNIAVPLDAPLGETRMRVAMKKNAFADPCEYFSFGEVEDYTVNIVVDTGMEPDYCAAVGLQPWEQWIAGVRFADIDQASFKNQYADFTNVVTAIAPGETYELVLSPGYSGERFEVIWRVWIDFNRNGAFDHQKELIFEAQGNQEMEAIIEMPADMDLGASRMRVAMQRDEAPSACGTLLFGEVEDYGIDMVSSTADRGEGANGEWAGDFKVYPNPSDGWFDLDLSDFTGRSASVFMLDMQGRVVQQLHTEEIPTQPIVFNLSTYTEGIYLLSVQVDQLPRRYKKVVLSGR
ncbi:MAG: GEVED domain-containing protein [Bacteroidota bacterium]